MNDKQLEFFRQKLTNWKLDLLDEATDTKDNLSAEGLQRPDIADRAQVESDASIQLRTRDRERKLISKIDAALRRIDLKTYGYCEDTTWRNGDFVPFLVPRRIFSIRQWSCFQVQVFSDFFRPSLFRVG